MDNIFKEKLEITQETVSISISCELRSHAAVPKRIYKDKNIIMLIPEELRKDAVLVQKPEKQISNVNSDNFLTEGVWVFRIDKKIIPEKTKKNTRNTKTNTTRTRRRRTSSKNKT